MALLCPSMTPILIALVSTLTLAAGHNVSHGQCNLDGLCLGDLVGETRFDYDTNTEGKAAEKPRDAFGTPLTCIQDFASPWKTVLPWMIL